MYAGENNEKLVANGYVFGGGNASRPLWIQGYYNHDAYPADSTNRALLLDPRFALFAPYLQTVAVYKCPSDRKTIRIGKQIMPKVRTYSMNWFVGWNRDGSWREPSKKYRLYAKTSDIIDPSPSELFVFVDVHPDSICWPIFGVEMGSSFFMLPAPFHNRASALAFADGHVDHKQWKDPRTYKPSRIDWHQHDYRSSTNKDLAWLQKHASAAK